MGVAGDARGDVVNDKSYKKQFKWWYCVPQGLEQDDAYIAEVTAAMVREATRAGCIANVTLWSDTSSQGGVTLCLAGEEP